MPRNLKGGNKAKKFSNKNVSTRSKKDTPIPNIEENSHVARVTGVLGDCRFTIHFVSDSGFKNESMISHLPKSSRKFGRVMNGSYVKVSKRDFENKSDILYIYDGTEVDYLIKECIIEKNQEQIMEENGISFSKEEEDFDISDI